MYPAAQPKAQERYIKEVLFHRFMGFKFYVVSFMTFYNIPAISA